MAYKLTFVLWNQSDQLDLLFIIKSVWYNNCPFLETWLRINKSWNPLSRSKYVIIRLSSPRFSDTSYPHRIHRWILWYISIRHPEGFRLLPKHPESPSVQRMICYLNPAAGPFHTIGKPSLPAFWYVCHQAVCRLPEKHDSDLCFSFLHLYTGSTVQQIYNHWDCPDGQGL